MSFGMMIACLLVGLYCDDYVDYSYLIRQLLKVSTLIYKYPGAFVIFHTKYPKIFRASLRSAQFFLCAPPLTWKPGSAPELQKKTYGEKKYGKKVYNVLKSITMESLLKQ
jgi:hypothetical protein